MKWVEERVGEVGWRGGGGGEVGAVYDSSQNPGEREPEDPGAQ